jgi:CubicO group peptidase (beta-lactamase class C family)
MLERMKPWNLVRFSLKCIAYVALIAGVLVLGFLGFLSAKYSPTYVYRLLALNVADVEDYHHFPYRRLQPAEATFTFKSNPNEAQVESLFHEELMISGFENFNDWAVASQTTAFLVIQDDTLLFEKYYNGYNRESLFHSQSVAKSFISLLIGCAIEDGLIGAVSDPITRYIPELRERDPRFSNITIKHLLMMTSGVAYNESMLPVLNIHSPFHDEAVGYYHDDVRKLLLEQVDVGGDPGKTFQYNNFNTSYLGLVIERVTGKTVSRYLEEKLWSRIMGYEALFSLDNEENGFEYMPSRLIARAIDYARFGRLILNEGNWFGEQIIPSDWIRESVTETQDRPEGLYPDWFNQWNGRMFYKYQWWGYANSDSTVHFFANGNLGQVIYIVPDQDLIMVHCGNSNALFSPDDLRHAAHCFKYREFHQATLKLGVEAAVSEFMERIKSEPQHSYFDVKFIEALAYAYDVTGRKQEAALLNTLKGDLYQAERY